MGDSLTEQGFLDRTGVHTKERPAPNGASVLPTARVDGDVSSINRLGICMLAQDVYTVDIMITCQ
jgi:hypothetical protein